MIALKPGYHSSIDVSIDIEPMRQCFAPYFRPPDSRPRFIGCAKINKSLTILPGKPFAKLTVKIRIPIGRVFLIGLLCLLCHRFLAY
jgi:hypothetical protein